MFINWFALLFLSLLFGLLTVQFLTVHPIKMSRYATGAALVFAAIVALLATGFRAGALLGAIPLALLGALAGYLLMARRALAPPADPPLPALIRSPDDPGLGHTAVVYFTHGEPETYDPVGWINQFAEFDEQKIPFVPLVARPFFLYRLRQGYLRVGRSNHRSMHQRMLGSLKRAYRAAGDETTRFYLSFLDDAPRPHEAVIQALNDGASRIIVSEVFLTISNHTAEGKELIEELDLARFGVPIAYTGPLYDSETLQSMFVERANRYRGEISRSKVGVLLVGHGQPDEWDVEWPTETEQELGFRQDVLARFEADGYKPENLSLAWMEFKEPRPAAQIEAFSRNGVEKVLYFSAAISADAMHSQYDVPALISEARVPDHLATINLGAWNDDPLVIQAIKEKIDALL
jgi:sirohydrochlorin ferrochelatase